jgi:small subunit ribosomal protein S2
MTDTVQMDKVQELFNLGAHMGHKKNRLHPKAKKFVYKMVDGVSVIDLTKTVDQLQKAKNKLKELGTEGKVLLVVATKKVAALTTGETAQKQHVPSMTTKWLPGLLTNFNTIIKNEQKMTKMKQARDNGDWDQFVKHERMKLSKDLAKLEKLYGGLQGITKKPDALLVCDIKKEKNAVNEARMNNIPVIACVDTNSNPDEVQFPIMMNDDAPEIVQHVMTELIEAYAKATVVEPAKEAKKAAK